ncbi:FIG021952: putative membrane protein [uncultured Candidatus Thioglobus sp.]|nr:FIG021952: putative membrane protein [uncultured Candidatus Thioglobus sp.]
MQKDSQQPSNKSLGTILSTTREKLALSQKEIAEKLNMNVRIIANLEAENFADLPSPIYIRGYIKHYARVVDLSADELIDRYEQILATVETVEILHDVNQQEIPSSNKVNLLHVLTYLTTFAIALICLVWVQQKNVVSTSTMIKSNENTKLARPQQTLTNANTPQGDTYIEII